MNHQEKPLPDQPWALSPQQARLWYLQLFEGERVALNMSRACRLVGDLDAEALAQALDTLLDQYPQLQCHVVLFHDQPRLVSTMRRPYDLTPITMAGATAREKHQSARDYCNAQTRRAFELEREAMLRIRLLQIDTEEHVLVVVAHPIVCSDSGLELLIRDIAVRYDSVRSSALDTVPLPAPATRTSTS